MALVSAHGAQELCQEVAAVTQDTFKCNDCDLTKSLEGAYTLIYRENAKDEATRCRSHAKSDGKKHPPLQKKPDHHRVVAQAIKTFLTV